MTTITLLSTTPLSLAPPDGGVAIITVVPRPWNIITAYAVVGASGVFDWVEGDLCALFGMGVGAGERRIYRRMRATRARRGVVWQVLGDIIRLGWER